MSKVDVSQAICQAIDIIVDKKLAGAGFNKTVQARIDKVIDSENGLYSIQYQDSIADNVQALDKNIVYEPGDSVMVLIPSNDWTGKKIIIASNKNLANTTIEDGEFYNVVGETVVYQPQGINTTSLSSYREINNAQLDQQIIFELAEQAVAGNQYNQKLKRYIRQSANGLILSAYIRTDFDNDRFNKLGIYGVDYTLLFNNGTENYTKTFTLNTRDVLGQPYLLNRTTLVEHIEKEINATEFVGVQKIVAYVENFNADNTKYNDNIKIYDVFISNVSVCAAQVLSDQQINGVNLWLSYPNGTRISTTQPGIIVNKVTIRAKLRNNGRDIDNNVQYRWYRENAAVTAADSRTDLYAGSGWECLHLVDGAAASLSENDFSFTNLAVAETDARTIQISAARTRIRCIAIYQNRPYSQYLTIEYDNGTSITLDSSDKKSGVNQEVYYNYNSTNAPITMTCLVGGVIDQNNYQYKWTIKGAGLNWKNEESTPSVVFSQLQNYSQVTFTCTVLNNSGAFIGTVSHTVQNKKGINGQYTVQILNGTNIIQYYDDGSLPEGMLFPNLQLAFYDPEGNSIDLELPADNKQTDIQQIIWSVPKNNTLIQLTNPPSQEVTGALIPDPAGSETDYYHIKNTTSLSYSFASSYNATAVNNTIHVYILYKTTDSTLSQFHGSTTFQIIKAGDPGTNGTDTVATIIPQIGDNEQPSRRIYLRAANANNLRDIYLDSLLTFGQTDSLKFKLVQNGTNIDLINSAQNVKWYLPIDIKNLTSYFSLQGTTGETVYLPIKNSNVTLPIDFNNIEYDYTSNKLQISNILRAKYSVNDLVYYTQTPLVYVYTPSADYKLTLKDTSGYTFVKYTESGSNPKYDNDNQFEIEVYDNNGNLVQTNLTYQWAAIGNLDRVGTSFTQKTFKVQPKFNLPIDTGNVDLRSGVKCEVRQNNQLIGILFAAIYMYKNRYNHPYLNDWDGNAIQLDANGDKTILAPEVGAGKKNNDNTFTGVLIGEVKTLGSDSNFYETGLFAYNRGQRTAFIDATTGDAKFGVDGAGQIDIKAEGDAIIQSGDYSQNSGMKIKFSSTNLDGDGQGPYIKYGSGNFSVNNQGVLNATNAVIKGDITANTGHIGGQNGWVISTNTLSTNNGNVNLYSSNHSRLAMQVIKDNQTVFSVGQDGELTATNAHITGDGTFRGEITAQSGHIGGWTIGADRLTTNDGKVMLLNKTSASGGTNTNAIQINDNNGNTVFRVAQDGTLTATKGSFTGTIEATDGHIGGWTINNTEINSTRTISGVEYQTYINSNPNTRKPSGYTTGWAFKAGKKGTASFGVTHDGYLLAQKGKIGGWTIGGYLTGGGNGTSVYINGDPSLVSGNFIRAGDNKGNIKFLVTLDGELTAKSGTLDGLTVKNATLTKCSIDAANITSGTINSGRIPDLSAGKITTGTMKADRISGGSLNFKNITVTNLKVTNSMIESVNASKINTGTISADRIGSNSITVGKLNIGAEKGTTTTSQKWRNITYARYVTISAKKSSTNTIKITATTKRGYVTVFTGAQQKNGQDYLSSDTFNCITV